jgi:hypothetical protein
MPWHAAASCPDRERRASPSTLVARAVLWSTHDAHQGPRHDIGRQPRGGGHRHACGGSTMEVSGEDASSRVPDASAAAHADSADCFVVATNYDQSCSVDSDCVTAVEGTLPSSSGTTARRTACAGAARSTRALPRSTPPTSRRRRSGPRGDLERGGLPLLGGSRHGMRPSRAKRRSLLVGMLRVQPLRRGDQRLPRSRVSSSGGRRRLTCGSRASGSSRRRSTRA